MTLFLDDPAMVERWCKGAPPLGFVPTMGALHAGHLALVRRALAENAATCVSIFVNPLQFDDPRDLDRYPRDLAGDLAQLEAAGATMVFTGTLEQFFPGRLDARGALAPEHWSEPGPAAQGLEGERRPGHFEGVATIVRRLFEIVGPRRAYFGQKDFQQTLVVKDLARRRRGPEIVVCPTVREASGLALSSRNQLLSAADRERASGLWRALRRTEEAWRSGLRRAAELRAVLTRALEESGLAVEYAEVRDPERWSAREPAGELERAVALVAARLSGVRLIDNHLLHAPLAEERR